MLTKANKSCIIYSRAFALLYGGVAQLGERTVRIRKVESSILFVSTKKSTCCHKPIFLSIAKVMADMLSKFEIALKECSETEGWLQLLFNTSIIDEDTYKKYRNLCGRII